jgi:hypothetical protein
MPQNHNRTMTLSKMAYSDNPEVASSYSFQIYGHRSPKSSHRYKENSHQVPKMSKNFFCPYFT